MRVEKAPNSIFQWEAELIVKCMAWPPCGGENEWPGGRRQGRHSKHAFKNVDLSFTFYSLDPPFPSLLSPFPGNSGMFVAPIVLVMEHIGKTIHAHCQRVFVCWMKSLPSTSSTSKHFALILEEMSKDLCRVEGPHSSGPLWKQGPRRRFSVRSGSLSAHLPNPSKG